MTEGGSGGAGPMPPPPERSTITGADGISRCAWGAGSDPLYRRYHDDEWGRPSRDGRHLFELVVLEGAQAGLSWSTILHRREGYRRAFAGFDPAVVGAFGDEDVRRLMADPGVVRNRLKIAAAVANARATQALGGDTALMELLWGFVDGVPRDRRPAGLAEIPAQTDESRAMSRELVRRGFRFVGPTICYALMQAGGMVNDHVTGCTSGDGLRAATG